jgi:hypothetical protein
MTRSADIELLDSYYQRTKGDLASGGALKITLNISKLVEEGKLTRAEADRLTALSAHDTGSLGINVLIGFGTLAIQPAQWRWCRRR